MTCKPATASTRARARACAQALRHRARRLPSTAAPRARATGAEPRPAAGPAAHSLARNVRARLAAASGRYAESGVAAAEAAAAAGAAATGAAWCPPLCTASWRTAAPERSSRSV